MNDDLTIMKDELEKVMEEAVKGTRYEGQRLALKTVPTNGDLTLHDQLARHEEVGRKLVERVHEVRVQLQEQFEKQLTEMRSSFDRKIHELQLARDNEQRRIGLEFYTKKAELEAMVRRLGTE